MRCRCRVLSPRLKSLCFFLCVCLLLSGCHGTLISQKEGESVSEAAQEGPPADLVEVPEHLDEAKKIIITFWAKNDSNKTQVSIYRKAIENFQTIYPQITVNLRLYTDYGKIYNDVITNIPTRTTPNVCISYPDHIATYRTGEKVMVALDEWADDPRYGLGGSELKFDSPAREEVVSRYLEEGRIDGRLYALPFMRSTEACYVNKTFVEALGYELPKILTWDFVWEVSEAALAKGEDGKFLLNGQEKLIPFIYKSTDNMMIQMLRQRDAGYSTEDGEILLFNPVSYELLQEVAEHAESRAFSTFKISGYPANWLNAGQCLFMVDSTAGSTWVGTDAPLLDIQEEQLVEFETAVLPIPQFDPEHPQMISQGPSVCLFYKDDPQEVLASWLFTQFLLTNEVQIAYSQTEGYVPVTEKARQDPMYQDYLSREGEDNTEHYAVKIVATKLLIENTENSFTTPVFNGSTAVRDASGQLIENVSKTVRRGGTVDEAYMEQLRAEVCSLYQLSPKAAGWTAGSAEEGGVLLSEVGESGALPAESLVLLCSLAGIWIMIGFVFIRRKMKKKKTAAAQGG